jgi:hypothetical protein
VGHVESWIGRKERHPVGLDAVVHRTDGSKMSVKLSDFSDHGCRIDQADGLAIGERISIEIARMGRVKAQVRWALADSAGAQFLTKSDV